MPPFPQKPIILVVDDTTENIDILKAALESTCTIRPATCGRIALMAAHIQPHPDLVLLDIMMPEMDGYEVCQKLKADEATRDIPIIFVTAKSEEADEIKGLQLGAVDYIAKPFSIPIVQARVQTHLALRAAKQKLDAHNQHLLQERALIESIILKMRNADVLDERHLRYLTSPVEETTGDMLLGTFTPDGRQLVLLGDFTGHGLPAAIGGPLVTYILHESAKRDMAGAHIFQEINNQLCTRLPVDIFFCAALLEISPNRQEGVVWNASLPACQLIRHGRVLASYPSRLLPLGVKENLKVAQTAATLSFELGDRFYAFSDGIIEQKTTKGDMFGLEKLVSLLEKIAHEHQTLDNLLSAVSLDTGSATFDDDITLVEVLL